MTQIAEPGDLRVIVRDEAWKQMRLGVDAVKSLDADLRLSRTDGCVQIIAAHKPSDMLTVGDAGSQAVAIAKDLMHMCGTKVLLGQDEKIGDDLSALLGLAPMAEQIVTDWATAAKGRALWLVGNREFKVQTIRSATEVALTDTNDQITTPTPSSARPSNADRQPAGAGRRTRPSGGHRPRPGGLTVADSPGGGSSSGKSGGTVAVAAPLVVLALLLVVLVGGGAGAQPLPAGCGSGGTAAGFGDVTLTAEQMGNAEVITRTTASRHLPAYAAVVAVAASWTEAKLVNDLVQHDHDSEGLFQIRVGLHGRDVAEDPVASTNWFLDALVHVPDWQTIPLTEAAADVERPAEAYRGRYAAAQPLATAVVSLLWPAASAAAPPPHPRHHPGGTGPGGTDPGAGGPDGTDPAGGCPSGGPDGGAPTDTIPCSAGGAGQVETAPGGVLIRVCAVGPFVVDTTISGQVAAMVAAASAAGLNLGGERVPQQRPADRAAPGALRTHRLRHLPAAVGPVQPTDRDPRPVDARVGPGPGHHQQRTPHRQPQRPGLAVAGRQRRPVRATQPRQ